MFSKTNYKRVVWLIVSIGVANGIAVASTQAPRCKHIGPFYGGEVHYFGDRELWTFVFYWCNGGYHLSPSNVKYSECTDNLEWDPTPPQCFQMANVYVPENGYYRGNKSNLLHGESYVIECKDKYEMFNEEDGFINFGSLRTRNNNGSLEPAVPKCLEKRCDPADQYKSIVKYPNGVRATSNILSQTTVKLECEQGYDYYIGNAPMETPVMRKCVKGNIENAPVCEEARCLVPGYPRNTDTQYRNYRTNSVLVDGHYMRPNNKLEVVCVNEADYELFVNSTGKYLKSFTSDCRFGLFDREAEDFPICLEKRCDPADQYKTIVKYPNGVRVTSKIWSQTTVKLECEQGYDYYIGNTPMETPVMRKCVKGNIENAPVCEEARCLVSGYPRNKDTDYRNYQTKYVLGEGQYMRPNNKLEVVCVNEADYELFVNSTGKYLESFTSDCRFGLFDREAEEFPICLEKRCDPADQNKAIVKYTNGSRVTSKILSRTTVTLECEQGYDFYMGNRQMETPVTRMCVKGNIEDAPVCEEGPCIFKPSQYACFTTNGKKDCISHEFKVPSRTSVSIKCREGYTLYLSKDGMSKHVKDEEQVTCLKHAYFQGFRCIPDSKVQAIKDYFFKIKDKITQGFETILDRFTCSSSLFGSNFCEDPCLVPDVQFGFAKNEFGDRVSMEVVHGTQITIGCDIGYDLSENVTTTCKYGDWDIEQFPFCIPKPCHISVNLKTIFWVNSAQLVVGDGIKRTFRNGTKIEMSCVNGYEMKDSSTWKTINESRKDIVCILGNWSQSYTCKAAQCSVPQVKNAVLKTKSADKYDHWSKVRLRCVRGHHFNEKNPNKIRREFKAQCRFGKWSRSIPAKCRPDSCQLKIQDGSTFTRFPHGTYVGLQCLENFDIFDEEGNIIDIYPNVTCYQGIWKNMYTCKKRCDTFNVRNGENMYKVENISTDQAVLHGKGIMVRCSGYQGNGFELKCDNGEWKGYVECNYKKNITNAGDLLENRNAVCEPNCKNEGVCYKDDHCKCKRLTEGKRCEIVRCDEQCTENGGECVAAGKCECPKGRYGPSCEKKSCRLPDNSAKPKEPRIMYNIGETLNDLECESGYILDSNNSMACQEDGSWSNIVHCVKSVVYLISVKTGDASWTDGAGTDAHLYIYLHGQSGNTSKINLTGNFENGDLDETRVEEKDIRPITGITIGHDGAGIKPDWFLKFVSIYVESMNEYYVFRYHDSVWVTASKDVTLPHKGNCVNIFDIGYDWIPRWDKRSEEFIGQNWGMSLRACQQKCTELTDFLCLSVQYDRQKKICWGLSAAYETYFYTNQKNLNSLIYRRSCEENI